MTSGGGAERVEMSKSDTRSPIERMVDAAIGIPDWYEVKFRNMGTLSCSQCGHAENMRPFGISAPEGTARIVTSCCPKCKVTVPFIETYYDSSGNEIGRKSSD